MDDNMHSDRDLRFKSMVKNTIITLGIVAMIFCICHYTGLIKKPDIYDNIMSLYNSGLFTAYFIALSISLSHKGFNSKIWHLLLIAGLIDNNIYFVYSIGISISITIIIIYLMTNIFYALIIGTPLVIWIMLLYYFNALMIDYSNVKKE